MIQMNYQNGRMITKADPLRQGEGGISASQQSDLLPTERVLLCKTPESRRGAYMEVFTACLRCSRPCRLLRICT
jgi:hypothetical protein